MLRPASRLSRNALLAGTSLLVLIMAAPDGAMARSPGASGAVVSAPNFATDAATLAAQQAVATANQSAAALIRATQTIQAMQAVQNAARAAAQASQRSSTLPQVSVPNGLAPGGLQVAPGATPGSALWQGANLPTQSVASGQTNVGIQQNAPQAILNWTTFNVGAQTTLNFNQQGNANWVALNRVVGSIAPSQILGNIKADGQVYVINQNGIIFGGGSQINVGSLIASSANITDSQFLTNGIYSTQGLASFTGAGGKIIVESGALITTAAPASVTSGGGFVLLIGTEIDNAGSITTPKGQTELAAGDDFMLRQGFGTAANQTSTTRGNEIAPVIYGGSSSGSVDNTGLIFSQQGDITLAGHSIIQDGILVSTTSVNQRGTIHLLNSASDATGSVTLTGNALSLIVPELNSAATALNSQRDALITDSAKQDNARLSAANAQFDNLSLLADREDQSRIEIVSGGIVNFQNGSQTMAPGGQVSVSAGQRVFAETGSTIDVSGVQGVALPMSANEILINLQGNELRDSPANRDSGALVNQNVWVDVRDLILLPAGTGGYATDRYYTPGGLLEVSGYLNTTAHTIGEWTALGGTITLSAPEVVTQRGSTFNISGGSVSYAGGNILSTNLRGADGRIYSVDNAPANMTFVGLAGGFTRTHMINGKLDPALTETWTSPGGKGSTSSQYEPGYTVGRSAGSLILSTPTSIFEGNIVADVIIGERQTGAPPSGITDGYKLTQNTVPLPGTMALGQYTAVGLFDAYATTVTFAGNSADVAGSLGATTALPTDLINTANFDAGQLSASNLGGLNIATRSSIDVNAALDFAPGAQVRFIAPFVDIAANITAPAGTVTITNILPPPANSSSLPSALVLQSGIAQITLESGATIDTRGLWTNALLDPNLRSGLAYLNGGAVSLDSTQGVTLAAGSAIDTSSGGAMLASGKTQGGAGGNITLIAGDPVGGTLGSATLVLQGNLRGVGVTKGGALKLAAASVLIGDGVAAGAAGQLVLLSSFFAQGFSSYDITGYGGVGVANGTQVNVVEPVYQFTAASYAVPTGSDPSSALSVWTPPVYLENPRKAQLTQRAGASIALHGNNNVQGGGIGPVTVGAGALLAVDPGQSIAIDSYDQITVDGTLRAPGGSISIIGRSLVDNSATGQSIWIGGNAVLDVAARSYIATDIEGRPYGVVPAGGSIVLGMAGDLYMAGSALIASSFDFIVVHAGAILDASGTSAQIDGAAGAGPAAPSQLATLSSDGGSITMSSYSGIYVDGTLRAAAGGAGAAGGTLAITLETPSYGLNADTTAPSFVPRLITIGQAALAAQLAAGLQPGVSDASLQFGSARFSADAIAAGGFGALSFTARDAILFDGNVTLAAGQSIAFHEGALADTGAAGQVTINSPYVLLDGQTKVDSSVVNYYPTLWGLDWHPSTKPSTGTFTVNASLIDVSSTVRLGIYAPATTSQLGTPVAYDYAGFGSVDFISRGDVRFVKGNGPFLDTTSLATSGNLSFTAAQLYPASGANAQVTAGLVGSNLDPNVTVPDPNSTIDIERINNLDPGVPYSVGGLISFTAATITQGGIIRAPFGGITLGTTQYGQDPQSGFTTAVDLKPGSITSASGAGVTFPYGGTSDNVTYTYNGITYGASQFGNLGISAGNVSLQGRSIKVEAGAVVDVSGGGNLAGAGFISGRGGSVNVLTTPLVNANPSDRYSAAGDQVFAIVPGYTSGYAPVDPGAGAAPGLGQQITIPAGVPGLAAGTYTLLPARYALLPGGYRVELGKVATGGPVVQGAPALGDGSYVVSGYQSIANTGVKNLMPTQIIVTAGATVRRYSQYNETGFSNFLQQTAAALGQVRPALPADAGILSIIFASQTGSTAPALSFDGTGLFQPAAGGYGGKAVIAGGGQIEVESGAATPGFAGVSVAVSDLNAIGANILQIGDVNVSGVTIRGDVVLSAAPEIALIAGASGGVGLVLDPGAVISTLGKGASTAFSEFYPIGDQGVGTAVAILVASNGTISFGTSGSPTTVPISVGDGAKIFSEGSIGFESGGPVVISDTARLGTRTLGLAAGAINIGEPAAMAGAVIPAGYNLTPEKIALLLAGDPAAGVPGIQTLSLTTSQSLNFFGTVNLSVVDSLTGKADAELILNTPAIYGYGNANDVATLTVGTLVWSGINSGSFTQPVSATPGAIVANGPGTGSGTLDINAGRIVFGFPGNVAPVNTLPFHRVMYGFSSVNLTAQEITSTNKNTLSVYQANGVNPGDPSTGGNLNLVTPLLTGDAGSVMGFTAGGALTTSSGGTTSTQTAFALGAEIDLTANSVTIANAIMLPSGKLAVTANNNILLQAGADLSVAGEVIPLGDQHAYSWGGDVILQSAHGNITENGGAIIDVSATKNAAGSLMAAASNGNTVLNGEILGGSTGGYDSGRFSASGQSLGDFVALNATLDSGGVYGARSFDIKQGDLNVDGVVRASSVEISIDSGSLTVTGTIDAHGAAPGSIRLAAKNNLMLASSAVLDAHGTVLQVDSYGQPIEAKNRGTVELTTTNGILTLASNASIDLRVTDPANVNSSGGQIVNYGQIVLNAPRVGAGVASATGANAPANATGNDIAISAGGALNILGAASIAVNGFATYANAPSDPAASGNPDQLVTQAYLDQIDQDSTAFMAGALANTALQARLAGLTQYGSAFHLRPGVEIDSATPTGDLTVSGDLNLASYRYGPNADRNPLSPTYGAGEPGVLVLRAGGNLTIKGSVTDGFGKPPAGPDDYGWTVMNGGPVGSDLTLISGIILGAGSTFGAGSVLGYDVPILGGNLAAQTPAPLDVILSRDYTVPAGAALPVDVLVVTGVLAAGTTFTDRSTQVQTNSVTQAAWTLDAGNAFDNRGNIYFRGDTVPALTTLVSVSFRKNDTVDPAVFPNGLNFGTIASAGTIVSVPTAVPAGTLLPKGTVLPNTAYIVSPTTLLANVPIPTAVTLAADYIIPSGFVGTIASYSAGQTIPAGTVLPLGTVLPDATAQITSMIWPKGDPLTFSGGVTTDAQINLASGSIIPAGANLVGPNGSSKIPEAGHQVYALAPMLPAGDLSWSMRLVSGADLQAADTRVLQPKGLLGQGGNLVLSDQHFSGQNYDQPSFSVLRTGTGSLDLLAGGNFTELSPFGIYTAGTQIAVDSAYTLPRGLASDGSGTVLGSGSAYESVILGYQAYYPTGGGDVLVSVQGDLLGNTAMGGTVGSWLWRQGGSIAGQSTAWWINFGTYVPVVNNVPVLTGFTGIGALGGGNVTIDVGGNAGTTKDSTATGLSVAIGGSGRVLADGTLVQTGGGDLTVRIGGQFNSNIFNTASDDDNGVFTDLRGDISISAGQIGTIAPFYNSSAPYDLRAPDPLLAETANISGAIVVVPGDGTVTLQTRGDLVLGGAADPGRVGQVNLTPFTATANGSTVTAAGGGDSWFSLWTAASAIDLFAAGGNLTPSTQNLYLGFGTRNDVGTGSVGNFMYPATLNTTAASGSIYFPPRGGGQATNAIELAPSANGQLNVLAKDSIYNLAVGMSGADPSTIATPFNPGFVGFWQGVSLSNASPNSPAGIAGSGGGYSGSAELIVFGADTATSALHANDPTPARIYAVTGDIVDLAFGEVVYHSDPSITPSNWYIGAKPARIMAGRDIINAGTPGPVSLGQSGNFDFGTTLGFILNLGPADVSIVSAGRDISYSSFQIAGPGVLDVEAGRNYYAPSINLGSGLAGILHSIGPVFGVTQTNRNAGAGITLMAGLGAAGPDYAGFANTYLNPASTLGLSGASQIIQGYDVQLAAWLKQLFGYTGTATDAFAYFNDPKMLNADQRAVFLRQVYFGELQAGGREYNDQTSVRFNSYLRGRDAIAALFPGRDAQGANVSYSGDITMFGGSGIHTDFGGAIQTLTPGGQTLVGVEGDNPPPTAGLITQGSGNIDIYSLGSVLLGQSRIMTTFGGDILAWSATGDINAGRGAKTSVIYTPPRRTYDNYGNITLAPDVPSFGAGIATLNPIPEVPAGNLDLIAPLGTIDAGEAGIRVSGNVNLAALQIVNAANIQVQGTTTGIPTVQAPNINGALATSNATAATQQTALPVAPSNNNDRPSIIIVEVVGYGGPDTPDGEQNGDRRRRDGRQGFDDQHRDPQYNERSAVQIAGYGPLSESDSQMLTPDERRKLSSR
jgi:filamentous hemagglutinin family protein